MTEKTIVVIGGPTASGKTGLALDMASEIHGQIVNADAIQVYKDLQILSARPSIEEQKGIPHYLFGYIDAWTTPSVMDWLNDVAEILPKLKRPVFVGGTGFYIDALINGINEIPDIPEEIRARVRCMETAEVKSLLNEIQFKDPQRMRRALEVQLATGRSLSYFQRLPKKKIVSGCFKLIHLLPQREKVYARCEQRLIQMLQKGMISEVENLVRQKACGGVMKAIGVPEIKAFLNGQITKNEMMKQILLSTRHYAKRQMTWFRHQGRPDFVIDTPEALKNREIIL